MIDITIALFLIVLAVGVYLVRRDYNRRAEQQRKTLEHFAAALRIWE